MYVTLAFGLNLKYSSIIQASGLVTSKSEWVTGSIASLIIPSFYCESQSIQDRLQIQRLTKKMVIVTNLMLIIFVSLAMTLLLSPKVAKRIGISIKLSSDILLESNNPDLIWIFSGMLIILGVLSGCAAMLLRVDKYPRPSMSWTTLEYHCLSLSSILLLVFSILTLVGPFILLAETRSISTALLLIGGVSNWTITDQVDIITDQCSRISSLRLPERRMLPMVIQACHRNCQSLLVCGGANEIQNSERSCFVYEQSQWRRVASLPRPWKSSASVVIGSKWYIFGGTLPHVLSSILDASDDFGWIKVSA